MRLTRRSIDISTTHRNLNTIRTIALFIKYSRQSAHHPQHHVGQRSLQLITFITQMSECVRAQIFCASIQLETIIHKTVCLSIVLFRVQNKAKNKSQTHRAASLREEWLSLIVGCGSFSPNRICSNRIRLKAKKVKAVSRILNACSRRANSYNTRNQIANTFSQCIAHFSCVSHTRIWTCEFLSQSHAHKIETTETNQKTVSFFVIWCKH